MNLLQILEAWKIANNPSEKQVELANLRATICDSCPAKKTITKKLKIGVICNECGCPITKKVYTNEYNPCPLYKWKDIDEAYFPEQKKTKSVI